MEKKCKCGGLQVQSFGLTLGIIWAVVLFVMAVFAGVTGRYGFGFVQGVGSVYVGYHPTFVGALIGMVWGFLDGFIVGMVFAWLYNVFCNKFCK